MVSFKAQSHMSNDGVLRSEVPTQDANDALGVGLQRAQPSEHEGWPPHFFSEVIGSWEGEFPPRDQGEYEVREDQEGEE